MNNSNQKQRGGFSFIFAAVAFLVVVFLYNPVVIRQDLKRSTYSFDKKSLKETRKELKTDKRRIRQERKTAKKERKEFRRSVRAERMSHYH